MLTAAAAAPNVSAKISGLNTMLASPDWVAHDLRDAVAVAVEHFGADRLVCGSDWPVALLNGSYEKVWRETVRVVEDVAPADAGCCSREPRFGSTTSNAVPAATLGGGS